MIVSVMRRMSAAAMLLTALLIAAAGAQAQGRWVKRAPFPEPSQEIAGASANGKLYIMGGLRSDANTPPKGQTYRQKNR